MRNLAKMGDRAVCFEVPGSLSRPELLAALRAIAGVTDVILAEEVGCVVFDDGSVVESIESALDDAMSKVAAGTALGRSPRSHLVHAVYDGEDLDAVAAAVGIPREAVIEAHSEREYTVTMLGFLPGFAYLRGLDPRLVLPRRERPRSRVPARSVALGANYTGIYPSTSPGGWHLIGRAVGFAPFSASGAAFVVGDHVRFEPVDPDESMIATHVGTPEHERGPIGDPFVEVVSVRGMALVVDGGRVGHMHEGVPRGGPLVPWALARANAAVCNSAVECGIEIAGSLTIAARGGALVVANDDGKAVRLEEGAVFDTATLGKSRVRYVAVEGGLDVPVVLGGRGTLLTANIGGLEGRLLRRGDRLARATRSEARPSVVEPRRRDDTTSRTAVISVIAGPDVDSAEAATLLGATFHVSNESNRVGTRLEGPRAKASVVPMNTARRPSRPMVRGAIEWTPAGPIVLGPDHPTTGGYPVVAVVQSDDLGDFHALPAGAKVRFRVV